jgi:hypothetical protein
MIESGKFKRMEMIVGFSNLTKLESAIRNITKDLLYEGFDDNDIKEYLDQVVGSAVDEVADPDAESF